MREFTTTAMASRPAEVLDAASKGGALLTRHGRKRFVIISTSEYQILMSAMAMLDKTVGRNDDNHAPALAP